MHLAAWSAVHSAATSTDSAPPRPGAGARGTRVSRSAPQLRRASCHDLLDEPTYQPRRSRDTLLWRVVSEHLEPFLDLAAERYQRPLPRYVEKALPAYLSCGDFERSFVRCHCEQCGHDILVPYACGTR